MTEELPNEHEEDYDEDGFLEYLKEKQYLPWSFDMTDCIQTSDELDQIAPALAKAQGEIGNVFQSAQGHNYTYAPLEDVLNVIRPLYAKNDLSLLQVPWTPPDSRDQMGVMTMILHKSGQFLRSRFSIRLEMQRGMNLNQSCGALLTYMRRYTAMGLNMVAPAGEDTDGISKQEKAHRDIEAKNASRAKTKPRRKSAKTVTKKGLSDLQAIETPEEAMKALTSLASTGRDAMAEAYKEIPKAVTDAFSMGDKDRLKELSDAGRS